VAEGTPNSHWHTLVVVPHLVKGGFVFGGKYGGGKQPTSQTKLCCADPFKVRFSFIYLILASNPSSKSAFLRHPIPYNKTGAGSGTKGGLSGEISPSS